MIKLILISTLLAGKSYSTHFTRTFSSRNIFFKFHWIFNLISFSVAFALENPQFKEGPHIAKDVECPSYLCNGKADGNFEYRPYSGLVKNRFVQCVDGKPSCQVCWPTSLEFSDKCNQCLYSAHGKARNFCSFNYKYQLKLLCGFLYGKKIINIFVCFFTQMNVWQLPSSVLLWPHFVPTNAPTADPSSVETLLTKKTKDTTSLVGLEPPLVVSIVPRD